MTPSKTSTSPVTYLAGSKVAARTRTWLPSCLEEPLLSLCVGEGDVILPQIDCFAPRRVLVSVETVKSEITGDPPEASPGPANAAARFKGGPKESDGEAASCFEKQQ